MIAVAFAGANAFHLSVCSRTRIVVWKKKDRNDDEWRAVPIMRPAAKSTRTTEGPPTWRIDVGACRFGKSDEQLMRQQGAAPDSRE